MKVRDTRNRKCIMDNGERRTYRIRRLRCMECGLIHQELPDFMMPFKHYESKVIEKEIDGGQDHCPAPPTTRQRWLLFFRSFSKMAEAILQRSWYSNYLESPSLLERCSLLQKFRQHGPGWLTLLNRLIIEGG